MLCATLTPVVGDLGDQDAMKHLRDMQRWRERGVKDEREWIVQALREGNRQADVARAIGRSREHIRKVADAHEDRTGERVTSERRRDDHGRD